jgi:hypothetical protein
LSHSYEEFVASGVLVAGISYWDAIGEDAIATLLGK